MKFTRIKPHYFDEENNIALFQGDCTEILPQLIEDGIHVNSVVSDPPYGIGYVSNHRKADDILGKAIHNDEDLTVVAKILPYLDELLTTNSALYFFGHPNKIGECRNLLDKYWAYKNTLVWDKGDAGTFGDLKAGYSLNYESIFYYNKGRRKLNGSRPRTILRYDYNHPENRSIAEVHYDEFLHIIKTLITYIPPDILENVLAELPEDVIGKALYDVPKSILRKDWSSRNDPVHATTKPVSILQLLIKRSTEERDIVIDPFMGSGTTGAAAKLLKRGFIGIELDPNYFRVAQDRIHNTKI